MKPRKNLENIHLGEKLAAINSINSWTKRARMDQMKLIFWMIIDLQEAAIQLHKDWVLPSCSIITGNHQCHRTASPGEPSPPWQFQWTWAPWACQEARWSKSQQWFLNFLITWANIPNISKHLLSGAHVEHATASTAGPTAVAPCAHPPCHVGDRCTAVAPSQKKKGPRIGASRGQSDCLRWRCETQNKLVTSQATSKKPCWSKWLDWAWLRCNVITIIMIRVKHS